jgi:hypothetical protein
MAQSDADMRMARQDHVHAGAELDQAHPLPALYKIAYLKAENNAAGKYPGNLAKRYIELVALNRHYILLILFRTVAAERIQVLAFLVSNLAHGSRDRRAVDMNIEDAEENAQANPLTGRCLYTGDLSNLAVRRRNHQACLGRYRTLGIAKKPEEKARQQDRYHRPGPTPGYQKHQNAGRDEPKSIKISVTHHVFDQTLGEL